MKHIHTFESFLNEANLLNEGIDVNAKKLMDAIPPGSDPQAKNANKEFVAVLKKSKVVKTPKGFKIESPEKLTAFFYDALASSLNTYSDLVKHIKDNEFELVSNELVIESF